jgi:hypothetical protein
MAERQIIWANRSANGDMLLNIELFDKNGAPPFIMHDNDWKLAGKVSDLQTTPQGRALRCVDETEDTHLPIAAHH